MPLRTFFKLYLSLLIFWEFNWSMSSAILKFNIDDLNESSLRLMKSNMSTGHKRIVNGYHCKINDHPYMAIIVRTKDFGHHCGGTILSESWILTAGHCIILRYMPKLLTAVAGSTFLPKLANVNSNRQVQTSPIVKHYVYPTAQFNDVGLMKLQRPFKETSVVQFVNLAILSSSIDRPMEEICNNGTVIGWGDQFRKDSEGRPLSSPLPPYDIRMQCVNVPVISRMQCSEQYGVLIAKSVICAYQEGKDACQGDSGGPLMCHGVQYGIVTSGYGCAYQYAGIYTRVDMYLDFIHAIMKSGCEGKGAFVSLLALLLILNVTCGIKI